MYRFTSVAIFLQYTLFIFNGTPNTSSAPYFLTSCSPHIIKPKHASIFLYITPLSTKYSLCVVIISHLASYFSCYARSRIHLLFFFSWICCNFNLTSTF
ncbi:uncharacterized protein EV154DRAFT_534424 [Mucor mucedo]|uniref:uncharacterized protein n=1 Tax=Mucor mucedo TaxID=29922 RepID=UPI00221F879A|nr:uncharacterized protein EV154DRAFT_534424 [Mucor mucedo]KAI7863929.1 hypothetical protein EV154DRAFT_534424 [Mucor mucedo]